YTTLFRSVVGIDYRLVTGPVPSMSDPLAFFAKLQKLRLEEPSWDQSSASSPLGWRDVIDLVNDFDRVEIWADPLPNEQLLLCQWLDWLSRHPGLIRKVSLVHPDFQVGDRTPENVAALGLRAQEVSDVHVQTAR